MNEIIDVEYREITSLDEKSTDELAVETNQLYAQAEAIANISLMYMAKAGARLEVIKSRLPHGEFENWCKDNLDFSKSKAEKMMKLSSKISNENSIFSKTESLTDIGITKVWALLSAPEEVVEQVINNPESTEMSTREFKEEIKKLKQELQNRNAETHSLEEELQKKKDENGLLAKEVAQISNRLASTEAQLEESLSASPEADLDELQRQHDAEVEELKAKIEKEKEKAKKAKAQIEAEKEKMQKEQESQIADIKAQAKTEATAEAEAHYKQLQESYDKALAEVENLNNKLKNSANESLAEFKVMSKKLQEDFNACLNKANEFDDVMQTKLKTALKQIINMMGDKI